MKTFICILILFSAAPVFSQTVTYSYDAAGNRTAKTATVAKAPQAPNELQTVTDIPNVVTGKDILVYPNPTQGHFTVDIANLSHENLKGEAYLYDTNGRLIEKKSIHSHSVHKKLGFDLTHKATGTYILRLRIGENTFTWKIIKK